jgi:hypothetical protein
VNISKDPLSSFFLSHFLHSEELMDFLCSTKITLCAKPFFRYIKKNRNIYIFKYTLPYLLGGDTCL